jgi:uncharacterized protein (TIGR02246 family)
LIEAQFARWDAALESRDPGTVAALFAPDGVLLPTVSNEVRSTPARIEAYFVDFLALSPHETVLERHVTMLDDTTAIDAGVWSFQLTRNGQNDTVTARYSFVWEKIDGVWRIQLLHSSLMPEPVAP